MSILNLSYFECFNFSLSGYTIEKIVDAVTKLVETNSMVYDSKRSDVQFFGRSKLFNEENASSDDDCSDGEGTKAPRPLQFRRNGNSISFTYKPIDMCTVESDLGGVGSLFNVVLNGSQELFTFGSSIYLKGFASERSDRYFFVACLELAIPIDSGGRFEYYLYCTTQNMLFTTTWSQFYPLKVPQRASNEFLQLANTALCDYMNKRAISKFNVRLPTKSSLKNEPSPVKKIEPKPEQKSPPPSQKKAPAKAKPTLVKRKVEATLTVRNSKQAKTPLALAVSNTDKERISELESQLRELQQTISKGNEKDKIVSSAIEFFEGYFNGKRKKFPSWTYLYERQYMLFCNKHSYDRCGFIDFYDCGRAYNLRLVSPRHNDKVFVMLFFSFNICTFI
jgi:hypothetical protein